MFIWTSAGHSGVRSETWALAGWLLGSRVRIPLKAWMFVRVFLCCVVLCRQRPCDRLITCPRSPTICLNSSRTLLYVRRPRSFVDYRTTGGGGGEIKPVPISVSDRCRACVLAAWILRSMVRISLQAQMIFLVFPSCAVLCRQRSCDGLVTLSSSPANCLTWIIVSEVILNWNKPLRLIRKEKLW
jgi:hypothetical protein